MKLEPKTLEEIERIRSIGKTYELKQKKLEQKELFVVSIEYSEPMALYHVPGLSKGIYISAKIQFSDGSTQYFREKIADIPRLTLKERLRQLKGKINETDSFSNRGCFR